MQHSEFLNQHVLVANYGENNELIKNFTDRRLSKDCLEAFVAPYLKGIPLTKLYIYHLKFGYNKDTVEFLVEVIKSCNALKELRLSNNNFNQLNLQLLFEALRFNSSIVSLYINHNNLGKVTASCVAKFLKINKTFFNLNLEHNKLILTDCFGFREALLVNKTLGILVLNNNYLGINMSVSATQDLSNTFPTNQTLVCFNVDQRVYNSASENTGAFKVDNLKLAQETTTLLVFPSLPPPSNFWITNLSKSSAAIHKQIIDNNNRFNNICIEIESMLQKAEDVLPINYNLKSIYILLQQLRYVTFPLDGRNTNTLEKIIYLPIKQKLEQYKMNYPLRVCGIVQGYQFNDWSKPFLPYELIVQIFSYLGSNYAAHINFTKPIPQIHATLGLDIACHAPNIINQRSSQQNAEGRQ